MTDRKFKSSKVGRAAMLSLAAMVSFNLLALTGQLHAAPVHGTLLVQTA